MQNKSNKTINGIRILIFDYKWTCTWHRINSMNDNGFLYLFLFRFDRLSQIILIEKLWTRFPTLQYAKEGFNRIFVRWFCGSIQDFDFIVVQVFLSMFKSVFLGHYRIKKSLEAAHFTLHVEVSEIFRRFCVQNDP